MKHIIIFLLSLGMTMAANAQRFDPQRNTITVVAPLGPGGPTDSAARVFSDFLSRKGYTSVTVNKPGGGGVVGTAYVAGRTGDNYTLVVLTKSSFYPPLIGTENLGYNENTLQPIGLVGSALPALALGPLVKSTTLDQLVEEFKQNNLRLNWGTFGGLTELYVNQLVAGTGVKPTVVLYRSSAALLTDVLSGTVQIGLLDLNNAKNLADSGKLRIISGPQIAANIGFWWGIYAAPGASREAVEWYSRMMMEMHRDPEAQAVIGRVFNGSKNYSLTEFENFHAAEVAGIKRLISSK